MKICEIFDNLVYNTHQGSENMNNFMTRETRNIEIWDNINFIIYSIDFLK